MMKVKLLLLALILLEAKGGKLDFETELSRECRNSCLKNEGKFCVANDFESGKCCDEDDDECSWHDGGFCSDEIVS